MAKKSKWDFSGWATRNDLKCSDGRTIRRNAFADCDGQTVPLCFMHQHNYPENILGHALLENTDDGVYAWGSFNDTDEGRRAKELVRHGDITSLSIYANQLKQSGGDVLHGVIREVSLVTSPANPGAYIEYPSLAHGEDFDEVDEAIIFNGMPISLDTDELAHSDNGGGSEDMDYEEIYDNMSDEQKELVQALVDNAAEIAADETANAYEDILSEYEADDDEYYEDDEDEEYYEDDDDDDEYYEDDDDDDEEYYDDDDDVEHGDYYGETFMKRNTFDTYGNGYDDYDDGAFLSHADQEAFETAVLHDMRRYGTFQDSFIAHAEELGYGIEDMEYLFPEPKDRHDTPKFIKRKTGWVKKVIDNVNHTPFSRVKLMFADITGEEARALGYLKGGRKKEEVFKLLKRTTLPTTIYKKQKIDRDDKLDLKNFKVVSWIEGEMKIMLEEECARAIMFGDNRAIDSEDHIDSDCIRPIYTEDDLFCVKKTVNTVPDEAFAKTFINEVISARPDYRGEGTPALYIRESIKTAIVLLEDKYGRPLYDSLDKVATKLEVSEIIPIPDVVCPSDFLAIEVNMDDYNVGTDAGGEVTWFDAFDIDHNQQKYLAETRFSGALITPFSAIAFKRGV